MKAAWYEKQVAAPDVLTIGAMVILSHSQAKYGFALFLRCESGRSAMVRAGSLR